MSLTRYDLDSVKKGIRNPALIKEEVIRRVGYPLLGRVVYPIKYRDSTIYNYERLSGFQNRGRDGIYHAFFQDIEVDETNYRNFKTYLDIVEFAHYAGSESILEIGAGVSTSIWAQYAARTGASVTSIDANTERLDGFIQGTPHQERVHNNVNLVEGVSINPDILVEFYSSPQSDLGGVPVSTFADTLDRFVRSKGCTAEQIYILGNETQKTDWSVRDVLIKGDSLYFPSRYLEERLRGDSIQEHASALADVENTAVLDDLIEASEGWDLIWFDSGEVSSMIEWENLKDEVNPGGLAAFHDIFFPKSMKNFAVAASLLHDPEWKVLLLDDTTKQGLLIAQKVA